MTADTQPFWEDELTPTGVNVENTSQVMEFGVKLFTAAILWPIAVLPALFLWFISPWLVLVWGVLLAYLLFINFTRRRQSQRLAARIAETQQQAQRRTQAVCIGSALHVAGHPLLKRDQPVVLALTNDRLAFYDYTSQTPIDTLPLPQLSSVQTVVYDDDRVPHSEVIDSAAQALQLSFTRNDQTWACLFRQMRKVRPVDWYHAIQEVRFSSSEKV